MINNHISEKVLNQVKSAGLEEKQALVYLSALRTGGGTITDLARASGVERTGLYLYLDELVQLGLLKPSTTRKRTVYLPSPPEKLLDIIRDREKDIEQVMPILQSMVADVAGQSQVTYYQGKKSVINLYEDYLKIIKRMPAGTELRAITRGFANMKAFPDYFPGLIERRARLPLVVRVIVPESERPPKKISEDAINIAKYALHTPYRKYVVDKYFPASTVLIFGDYVVMIDTENFFGSITKSQGLAKTWESVFEFMWDNLPDK